MFSVRRLLQIHAIKYCYSKLLLSSSTICLSKPQNAPKLDRSNKSYKHNLSPAADPHFTTEKQFFASISPDPDTFGDPSVTIEDLTLTDAGDIKEETFLTDVRPRPLSTKQYADMIKGFIRKRKIKEALDVLEVRMLKEDKVQPENYIYNLLMGACGRVGYTKKAFSLFNNMKKRGLKPTDGTYTALFTACSNSPWPTTDGLSRATHLRTLLQEAQYTPNDTTYNAMIKAFGRCGDIRTAFALVDERCFAGWKLSDDTCNFMLQACIENKEAGFRHAVLVWDKMRQGQVKGRIWTFNLLLRCLRDCGLGDLKTIEELLRSVLPESDKFWTRQDLKQIEGQSEEEHKEINESYKDDNSAAFYDPPTNTTLESCDFNTPDLLASPPRLGNILSLSDVTLPPDKLLLLGGCLGFLRTMLDHGCVPDIKTFTLLLDCIPQTAVAEEELIREMKKFKVEVDTEWCNVLIKRRSMRGEYDMAENVLEIMESKHLAPDLITYGVLAIGCKFKEDAESLIERITKSGYRLNTEILGAMLYQAYYHTQLEYAIWVLDTNTEWQIKPNKIFMQNLEKCKKKFKFISNDRTDPLSTNKSFTRVYSIFKLRYKTFIRDNESIEEEKEHPWQQYRQETETDVLYYKDKDSRFKPRRSSYFMQKTSTRWSKEEKDNFVVRKLKDKESKKKLERLPQN